ncbi:hypothetical protein LTR36_002185 [Oleoguttula mirabilis]|uniref:F-box domain-containing protein n=1 Tax=Oleoguttula mirabilis TaxID=1507867 RepID=A0AAV9JL88_9PEZI|nr:hypothetical protein LTR36_002185 [Oleoguttula mirabilis]
MVAAMDPSLTVASDRPTLLTLPNEIQDIIFCLAYPRLERFTILSESEWNNMEKAKQRRDSYGRLYAKRAFPGPAVNALMVSKAFFATAAKAHIGNQVVTMNPAHPLGFMFATGTAGICTAFAREIDVDIIFSALKECTSLRKLAVSVSASYFDRENVYPCDDELDESNFGHIKYIAGLVTLRGLQHFTLKANGRHFITTEKQQQTWDANMRRLETYIKCKVLLPKVPATTSKQNNFSGSSSLPLYAGSAVSASSSQLLQRRWTESDWLSALGPHSMSSCVAEGEQASSACLCNDDVPEDLGGFSMLLFTKGADVMAWVREAKAVKMQMDRGWIASVGRLLDG